MRFFDCDLGNIDKERFLTDLNSQNSESKKYRFYAKRLLNLYMFCYKECPEKKTSFNRGTIYLLHHSVFYFGFLSQKDKNFSLNGIVFEDVFDKMFFVLLTFFGLWYVTGIILAAVAVSVLVYWLVSWISIEDDKKTLRRFEKLIERAAKTDINKNNSLYKG